MKLLAKRVKYVEGDVFELRLDENGNIGYGRILKIDKPSIFVELFELQPSKDSKELKTIREFNSLFSVWCTDNGLKKGIWNVIGNIPVIGEVTIPDFWTTDAFTDKILLVRGEERIEISKEQIGDLLAAGIYGHEAVRLTYIQQLVKKGLYHK